MKLLRVAGRSLCYALPMALFAGCSESTDPTRAPTLTVTDDRRTDTVTAFVGRFTVTVTDSLGHPATATEVALGSIPNQGGGVGAFLLDGGGEVTGGQLLKTDSQGRVSAAVRLGGVSGPAEISVVVARFGLEGRARYTVEPGHPAAVQSLPKDTALRVGRSFDYRSTVVDRYGNAWPDPVLIQSLTSALTVSTKTATAVAFDRAKVLASSGSLSDTAFVSVVPEGTIAAVGPQGLFVFQTDFTDFRQIPASAGDIARWHPNGTEIITDAYAGSGRLKATPLSGTSRFYLAEDLNLAAELAPAFSGDGQFVYFTGRHNDLPAFGIFRASADGTNATEILDLPDTEVTFAAPSPDGTRLVYVALVGFGELRQFDLRTRTSIPFAFPGHSPVWSPTGELIAFLGFQNPEGVKVVRPDGSGLRTIAGGPDQGYSLGMDWSPDGNWIVATETFHQRIVLLNAHTGLVLPLPSTGPTLGGPSWRR